MSTTLLVLVAVSSAALVVAAVLLLPRQRAARSVKRTEIHYESLPPGAPRIFLQVDEAELGRLYLLNLPSPPDVKVESETISRLAGKAHADASVVSGDLERERTTTVRREQAPIENDPGRRSRILERTLLGEGGLRVFDLRPDESFEDYYEQVQILASGAGLSVSTELENILREAWQSAKGDRDYADRTSVRRFQGMVQVTANWVVDSAPDPTDRERRLLLRTEVRTITGQRSIFAVAGGSQVQADRYDSLVAGRNIAATVVGFASPAAGQGDREITSLYCYRA